MFVKPVWLVYNGFICLSDCQNEVETLPRSGKAIKTIKILHCHQISPQSSLQPSFQRALLSRFSLVIILTWKSSVRCRESIIVPFTGRSVRQTFPRHVLFCYFIYGWQSSYNITTQILKNLSDFRVCDYYVIKTFVLRGRFWTYAFKENMSTLLQTSIKLLTKRPKPCIHKSRDFRIATSLCNRCVWSEYILS